MRIDMLLRPVTTAVLAVAFLALQGCGRDGRLSVSGTVTLNGVPLASGSINFRPVPGNPANSSGGMVKDGRFKLPAAKGLKPGKYLVTVQAFKESGRMIDDLQMGKIPELLPVKFNEADLLEATVNAGSDNRFDFQLTGTNNNVSS